MTNYFDSVAQNWDANQIHHHRTEAIAAEIRKLLPKKEDLTAMEFGAGTGLLSIALKEEFSEIMLMDNSLQMVCVTIEKLAEDDIFHLKPYFFDLEKNIYSAKNYDVIFSQMAMHHTINVEDIIAKFYNILNNNGLLIIADLYTEDGTFHDREFSGHLGFEPRKLAEMATLSGFTNIKYHQCYVIEKQTDTGTKQYPVFIFVASKL